MSYSDFCKVCEMTKKKEKKRKKLRNLCKILLTHISRITSRILLKFKTWPPLHGGKLQCKFGAIWIKHYGATDAWKLRLCCSCQYTHSVCALPVFLAHTTHYRVSWLIYWVRGSGDFELSDERIFYCCSARLSIPELLHYIQVNYSAKNTANILIANINLLF